MADPTPLHECTFYADPTDRGHYIGRCREWPDLRSRPHRHRLDAIDDVIDKVSDKLRHVHASINGAATARKRGA